MARVRFNRKVNIGRVIGKIVTSVLVLWVGSMAISAVAVAMNCTNGVFQTGMTFIGLGETTSPVAGGFNCTQSVGAPAGTYLDGTVSTTGILSIIGIVAVASIVMEFVTIKL